MSEAGEPFRIELTIAAPVADVWRALRDPARIRQWHGWHYEERGGLDAEIEAIFLQDVTEDEASHTLVLRGKDTFTVLDTGDGHTMLRMVRAPKGGNPDWDDFYEDINEGWITFTQQLKFALERHSGAERRTVFLYGVGNPLAALGVTALDAGRHTVELAGRPESGELWFRTANQVGITVDGWGDGLLVAGAAPASTTRPGGGAMAVLTTYGLDDAAYEELRDRWTSWWQARFPAATPAEAPATSG